MVLRRLSEAAGISGQEQEVRAIIRAELEGSVHRLEGDTIGNLIAVKNPGAPGPRVMLAAHMDEVGLMISGYERSGMLKFRKVGGIDDRVLVSKGVRIGKDRIPGVIGAKAIHLQEPKERETPLRHDQLYIDIGAKSKEEAEKKVQLGEYAVFDTAYSEFGEGLVKGKALDDRIGCAVLISLLKEDFNLPVYGCFTVQEEVGLRGAAVSAYRVNPQLGLAVEGTVCADVPGVDAEAQVTALGRGPALTIADAGTLPNRAMLRELIRLARESNVPYQFRRTTVGATDAGRIHLAREGVPSAGIAVPCRYIHSPVSVASLEDFQNTVKLLTLFLRSVEGGFRP
ncbi:MAG: M42 family metallopeptidase [Bacillota bacterium]